MAYLWAKMHWNRTGAAGDLPSSDREKPLAESTDTDWKYSTYTSDSITKVSSTDTHIHQTEKVSRPQSQILQKSSHQKRKKEAAELVSCLIDSPGDCAPKEAIPQIKFVFSTRLAATYEQLLFDKPFFGQMLEKRTN